MLLTIEDVLTPDELAEVRSLLSRSRWADGLLTAGTQAATVKNNQQLPEDAPHLPALRRIVLDALNRNALFFTAALPLKVLPPFFNRYAGASNHYGEHVDSAMRRTGDGGYVRADVSATLFLSDPDDYDGGVLTIRTPSARHGVKLDGAAAWWSTRHRRSMRSRRSRAASDWRASCSSRAWCAIRCSAACCSTWTWRCSSCVEQVGETEPVVKLTGVYHNLLRRWAAS